MLKRLTRIGYHRRLAVARWLVLIAAAMRLLGDKNCWIPKWLDRVLPTIQVDATAEEIDTMRLRHERPEPAVR